MKFESRWHGIHPLNAICMFVLGHMIEIWWDIHIMLEYRFIRKDIDRKNQPLADSSIVMGYNCVCWRSPGDSRRGEVRVKSSVVRSPAKARRKKRDDGCRWWPHRCPHGHNAPKWRNLELTSKEKGFSYLAEAYLQGHGTCQKACESRGRRDDEDLNMQISATPSPLLFDLPFCVVLR